MMKDGHKHFEKLKELFPGSAHVMKRKNREIL